MRCPECGNDVPENLRLCPECGVMVEETQPMRVPWLGRTRSEQQVTLKPEPEPESQAPTRWQRLRPVLFWVASFICLLTVSVGGAAYTGLYQGERDREQKRQDLANQHYQAGLQRLDAGEYELAIAEFEYVLKLDPDHPIAQQGIDEAEARIAAIPTPTVETYEIAVDDLYEKAVGSYEAEEWRGAIDILTQIRALDPTYRAEAVEEMLFTSLYNAGMALLEEDRFEEGIFYLDRAVALRPLDEEALTQRRLANKYMKALDYWGVDWDLCIERFEELYSIAPNYKDVFSRLYRAHVTYADAWYAQGEMCPAEVQYSQALQLRNDPQIEQKQAEANQICLVATPTPVASITGTVSITLTEPLPGFNVGRLAYPSYNTQTGIYDVYALFADGRLIRMASGADQPCWVWGNSGLGYRNLLSPGIALFVPGETTPQQLTAGGGQAWPTFSPDGRRMAYAAQDTAGTWQIYITPTDGSTEPEQQAEGRWPAWGPTGLLAWNGCETGGNCGIFVDNPDDDQPPTRLSDGASDIALNWSPDGGNLAYMANHTGNWEIYLVSTAGGFAQLTDNSASDGLPAWAPNGSGLAFVSNRDGTWGIYLMGPNGEDPHKILTLGPNLPNWTEQRLSWAP